MTAAPSSPLNPVAIVASVIERARHEVILAHFIGKVAVDHGAREARRRLAEAVGTLSEPTDPSPASSGVAEQPSIDSEPVSDLGSRPTVDQLALADYDHLPSAHIVVKLEDLEQDERDAIEAYELGGRHRRTILGKLELLRSADAR